jgi:hypothetical protein
MKKTFIYIVSSFLLVFLFSCQNESISPNDPISDQNSELNKKGGSALDFDGSTGYVAVPDDPSLDITSEFTITAWVYLRTYTEWASVVTKGGDFGPSDPALDENNYTIHQSGANELGPEGRLRFTASAAAYPFGSPESNTQIPLNEWHHIAVTFDGSVVKFYLDGSPDGETPLVGPLNPNNDDLRIGVDPPGGDEYWNGMLDEIKIWNETLSLSQILTSMHGSATPRARSLVGFWRFNEGHDLTVRDRSRNHNDGVLNGVVTFSSPGAP